MAMFAQRLATRLDTFSKELEETHATIDKMYTDGLVDGLSRK